MTPQETVAEKPEPQRQQDAGENAPEHRAPTAAPLNI